MADSKDKILIISSRDNLFTYWLETELVIVAEKESEMETVWEIPVKHNEVMKEKEHLMYGKVVDSAGEDSTAEASVASTDGAK